LKLGVGYVSVLDKKLVQKQVLHKVIFLLFGVFHHLLLRLLKELTLGSFLVFSYSEKLVSLSLLVFYTCLVSALSAPVFGFPGLHSNCPGMVLSTSEN